MSVVLNEIPCLNPSYTWYNQLSCPKLTRTLREN
jgi:hypothetical protein